MSAQFYNLFEEYQVKFYQLPKVFFTNPLYKKLSNDSKMLYALLKDRLQLSIKNNWVDEQGNIYFIYTNKNLSQILNVSERKISILKKELIESNLLVQKKVGYDSPFYLYLMKPQITKEDIYKIDRLDELADSASSIETPTKQDSHELANSASSVKTPVNQSSYELAESASLNSQILLPNDTEVIKTKDNKDNKESQNIDFSKNSSFNNAFKNVVPESEQDLVTAYIKQNGLEEMYGQNFINILKMRAKDDLSLLVETMNAINHSLRSAEKEMGYTIGVHFYEGSMYSEPLREDFTTTLYSVLLKIRTDHKVKDAKSYFFISFKNTAEYWVKKIKKDNGVA